MEHIIRLVGWQEASYFVIQSSFLLESYPYLHLHETLEPIRLALIMSFPSYR